MVQNKPNRNFQTDGPRYDPGPSSRCHMLLQLAQIEVRLQGDCLLMVVEGVINLMPFLSLVLAGEYFKYKGRTSRIPSIICAMEIKKMLVAECRGVFHLF